MEKFIIKRAEEDHFLKIREFISKCDELYAHPEHFYKIAIRYFKNTFFTAQADNKIIGVLWGFFSQTDQNVFFLWQIGVSLDFRGQGAATALIKAAETELKKNGSVKIEVTVDPENMKSRNLFEKNGYKNTSFLEGECAEVNGAAAVKDYYSPGRHFIIYSKKI